MKVFNKYNFDIHFIHTYFSSSLYTFCYFHNYGSWFSITFTYWLWPCVERPTSNSIDLKFTAMGCIEPNHRLITKSFWFHHPCRKSNVILMFDLRNEKSKKSLTLFNHISRYTYHSNRLSELYKLSMVNLRMLKLSNFGKLNYFSPMLYDWWKLS